MISIAIPIYNFDVSQLVAELRNQMEHLEDPVEIILIDDASDQEFRKINQKLTGEGVQYIQLNQNVGRATIRNLFLKYVRFNHILFLDADGKIEKNNFLSTYLEFIKSGADVICGGRVYPSQAPEKNRKLRWKYGVEIESRPADERRNQPHLSFMTNNFIVSKVILDEVSFNEKLKGYGHEDTLFGFQLMKRKIPIHHLDNPVVNDDIETNEVFLKKTEEGIKSLVQVLHLVNEKEEFTKTVHLLNFHKRNRLWMPIFYQGFKIFRKQWKHQLISGKGSLRLFNMYKLGVLHKNL